MQQLAPEVEQFPEAAKLVGRMQNMLININASSGIVGKFQSICAFAEDANTMRNCCRRLAVQALSVKDNPDMADMLDKARVAPSGDRVILICADQRADGFADQAQYCCAKDVGHITEQPSHDLLHVRGHILFRSREIRLPIAKSTETQPRLPLVQVAAARAIGAI